MAKTRQLGNNRINWVMNWVLTPKLGIKLRIEETRPHAFRLLTADSPVHHSPATRDDGGCPVFSAYQTARKYWNKLKERLGKEVSR
jgi:hypothetical protein